MKNTGFSPVYRRSKGNANRKKSNHNYEKAPLDTNIIVHLCRD